MLKIMRLAAAIAAGLLACVPATGQRLANFPPAGTPSGTDTVLAQQPSLCAAGATCSGVLMTLDQVVGYVTASGRFQLADADLTAIAALSTQGFGRSLLTMPDAASMRVALGVTATGADTAYGWRANNLSDLASASAARANLGVSATGADPTFAKLTGATFTGAISAPNLAGTNTGDQTLAGLGGQPLSPILTTWAGLTLATDTCVYWTGLTTATTYPCTALGRKLAGSSTGSQAAAAIGTSYILARSTVAQSVTGTTSETTLATIAIPAGAIGPNGFVEVVPLFTNTSSSNVKTFIARLNGNQIAGQSSTVNPAARFLWGFNNVNSQAAQIGIAGSGIGATGTAAFRLSVDTSVASTLTISCTLAASSDTCTLESWLVRIIPGA